MPARIFQQEAKIREIICHRNLFLKSIGFENDNLTYVKKWINRVKSKGGWLIIHCHGIVQDDVSLPSKIYGWSHKSQFNRLLNYIKKKEIRIVTFKDINENFK